MKKTVISLQATGRRKTAVARVFIKKGTGAILVNGRPFDNYFPIVQQRETILSPLVACKHEGYDISGGIEGQAIAMRLGLARALVEHDENHRITLKPLGFLTRDPRKRERKKYGQPGARKRFQFSKR